MFRAYDAERERLVAVKLFRLDLPPERVHQLVAEFERLIAAELIHPVLASPLATGIYDVSAFLVQDYVAADSLDLVLREYGPAPPADVLRVAAQLAGALDFAAAVNITHGALHPRDVLLSSDDTRLTGAGVARAIERVGVALPVRRPYSSPECVAGAAWDRCADVFSLAALIHELFWARRVSGLGAQAVAELTAIPGGDLPALRETFARALAEEPAERYETALAFAEALKNAFPEVTAAASPAAAPPPPRRAVRKAAAPQLPLLDPPSPEASASGVFAQPVAPPLIAALDAPQDVAEPVRATQDLPLSLADSEEERYRDVEVAPAIVEPGDETVRVIPADPIAERDAPPEMRFALERSRSATWPIVLALGVGLMIGFAAGFGFGIGGRPAPAAGVTAVPPVSAGREFTESAVADAPRPGLAAPNPSAPRAAAPETHSAIRNRQPAMETGRLLVRSTPAGARVFVDDQEHGRTPAIVHDLTRGSHRLRLERDGYQTEERRVVMTPSRPSLSMTVPLSRRRGAQTARAAPPTPATIGRFTGALTVVSRPEGASVFVDGKLAGTTPLSLPGVAAGSHVIRLELQGHRRWTSSVRIVATEQNRVTASLER